MMTHMLTPYAKNIKNRIFKIQVGGRPLSWWQDNADLVYTSSNWHGSSLLHACHLTVLGETVFWIRKKHPWREANSRRKETFDHLYVTV